jgi:carboxynorspermidine decarboxylase
MHSKLGVDIDALITSEMFAQIQGLHWHNMFSATDFAPLTQTVKQLRRKLGGKLASLNWLNLGGGYLYGQIKDHQSFIDLVAQLISDFDIEVFIEPGKALVGHAGFLVATIIDCFRSDGKIIAVLDTSINHHPELFEFQRTAELHEHTPGASYPVILAGCTCLAGDLFGEYRLTAPVKVGDKVLFKQVGAYSLIKAHRFNGYNLPDIYCYQADLLTRLKHYDYQNYRQQWLAD